MDIKIDNSKKVPIFKQIKEQIKDNIVNNKIDDNTLLPSIRSLANDMDISIMTVKKAYDDLLDEEFIVTIPGKGSYINKKAIKKVRKEKIKKIEELLGDAIDIAKSLNITKEELLEHYLRVENKKRD